MGSCGCGCGGNHPSIKAKNKQNNEFGTTKTENAGVMIRPDRVKELKLDENGTVTIVIMDETEKPVEELNIEFENPEVAESWIMEKFGNYL